MTGPLRLRPELIIAPQETHFVIKDPVRNTFVRLGAAEMLVARHFDGASTLEDIQGRLSAEHGLTAPMENLVRFRDRLHALQLIVAPGERVAAPDPGLGISGGRLQKVFLVRLPFEVDPDRFLAGLYRRTRFLFSRGFLVAAGVVLLGAAAIWVSGIDAVVEGVRSLASAQGVGVLVLALVVSVSIHEVAHGLAVKARGGNVRRMGVILHYFLPRFYTDVSDAWLFPDKRSRALVIIAGPFASVLVWGLATVAWSMLRPQSVAATGAMAFMVVNVVGVVRTLIPFLTGDGYLLLSNALDRPNLRQRSIDYASTWLKGKIGLRRESVSAIPPSERRLYLLYTAGAVVSSLLLATGGVVIVAWLFATLTP